MKILKRIILLTALIIAIIAAFSKVNAASANISSNKTSMNVGDTATITVSYTAAAWNVQVSGAANFSSADASSNAKNISKSAVLKFKPKKAGTYTVNLSGDVTDQNGKTTELSKTIKIKVKEKSSNNSNSTDNNTTTDDTTTTSTDATLSNLGIKPNDFSGFRKANTSYSVSVPKNVDKISIYATPSSSKATVTGTGSKTLQIGRNTFNIKVTAEDKKTTKTYTLTITRKNEDENESDATLTNLGIRPKEYDFTGFRSNTTSYNVSVPNDVEKITIYGTAKSNKATISGLGSRSLQVGTNKCEVKVTSSDKKTTKTYIINVKRKEVDETEEKEENNETTDEGLKNIKIKDINLSPTFSQDIYTYNVSVPSDTTKLDIQVEKTSDNIEVEIAGNDNLKQGQNVITLLVHNKKDDTTSTYQINATIGNQGIDLSTVNNELKDAKSNAKKQEWIIKGTIIVIIVLIIIYLIQRYKITKEQEDDENDYEGEDEDDEQQYYYSDDYKSTSSEDLRKIGLFDDTQKIEFDEQIEESQKKHGRYKGRRFK